MILLQESMRWFGPGDPVSLHDIRQCGCTGVMSSLHHIEYGELWSREEIATRKAEIEAEKLTWRAVESVPVSEAIKTRTGNFEHHIENYKQTIRNLGAESINTIIYNFMPVLDWTRTDMAYTLPDGTQTLLYDPVMFAVFDIHLLQRPGAEKAFSSRIREKAAAFIDSMSKAEKQTFEKTIIDVFPGMDFSFTLDDIRAMLSTYKQIDRFQLLEHLKQFLQEVIPVCEENGVRMAIHPDDPPFPVLGLPRIVSTESDLKNITDLIDSPANGICFCTGSLSPREDNDLPGMVQRLGHRINAFHFRSTQRNPDGSFYEANHLEGSVNMPAVVKAALQEMQKRKNAGREDWQLTFRPDHGRTMLDDLKKPPLKTPGYTCIGRLRGLAEIRGLQLGLQST
ncbi:mannonate dehydratase [Pontiella agarivorans]|uniref:Mannonate dehydratase n=1 Tax=Pontiella agarivorans TaxID=3038953 RepID=A0ABU5N2C9_9BACT|nr:mannonate dehydratase [Pontiella agarivorans]MDZ8120541.1 mannonate dehydratase [Pontiella agarivorans]